MAFDERLAERIRTHLGKRTGLAEKKMFGGIAFLVRGNMCCGVHRDALTVRLDPAETDKAVGEPHTQVFDLTGRPMKGWILVDSKGVATEGNWGSGWIARPGTPAHCPRSSSRASSGRDAGGARAAAACVALGRDEPMPATATAAS